MAKSGTSLRKRWLQISIPIQAALLLSQLVTGLNSKHIPAETYEIVHEGGGILLVSLVIVHVIINWGWVRNQYSTRRNA